MRSLNFVVLFLAVSIFGSCENSGAISVGSIRYFPQAAISNSIDSSFQGFVSSIPLLGSKFTLSNREVFEHIDLQSKFIPDGAALIGRLNSIDNYAFIIYSYPADIRLPILEVYNSEGIKVNQQLLFKYGYCKLEPGPDHHEVELSADRTKFYLTTTCNVSFSAFDYDSVNIQDLIFR